MVPRSSAPLLVLALALGPLLALAVAARPAAAQEAAPVIYKWVDQHGIAHYTTDPDNIPSSLRNRIRDVSGDGAISDAERWAVRDTPTAAPARPLMTGPEGSALAALAPVDAERIAAIDDEIAGLETEIAQDEATLVEMLSRAESEAPLSEDPAFREIAKRLPRLEEELRALRERRASLEGPRNPTP